MKKSSAVRENGYLYIDRDEAVDSCIDDLRTMIRPGNLENLTKMPNPKIHELKTWPEQFDEVWRGQKTHEVRVNDRNFQVGDILILREWEPPTMETEGESFFTGRHLVVEVTSITQGGSFGLPWNMCVMSFRKCESTVLPNEDFDRIQEELKKPAKPLPRLLARQMAKKGKLNKTSKGAKR